MGTHPYDAWLGRTLPEFTRLEEEVHAAVWPRLLAVALRHQSFPTDTRLQVAKAAIQTLDITLLCRLIQLPGEPLELATDSQPFHRNANVTSVFDDEREKPFSVSLSRKNRNVVIRPEPLPKRRPDLPSPLLSFHSRLRVQCFLVGRDHLIRF